ncbi:MAG: DNA gyrase inhibitor YacG [Phycisphaerales bacterium]
MKCPICKKKIREDQKGSYFPFCSERCKLVDLNSWFDGNYIISSPIPDEKEEDDDEQEK